MIDPTGTLVLVPTELERRALASMLESRESPAELKLCGFGPVAAAVSTASWIATTRPQRILLIGLAGTFDTTALPIQTATCFAGTVLDGVGAGTGADYRSAEELGFSSTATDQPHGCDHEMLPLAVPREVTHQRLLLTSCTAAASPQDIHARRQRFPAATAEDMEAFGVALACRQFSVPMAVIRGICNQVGDREHANWQVQAALESAWQLAERALAEPTWEQLQ